jgi:predicted transcriptional regulator
VWVRRYRVSPMAGRVVGYLLVCEPAWQRIDELATALQASRSAAALAVKDLTVCVEEFDSGGAA